MVKGRKKQKRRNYKMNFNEFADEIVALLKGAVSETQ